MFAAVLAADPSRPFVSFYDDATGEWAEMSAKSVANWVAKTHFLLIDELGLGVGDRAFVDLPAHWISVPILLGCWSAGLDVSDDPGGADVAFVTPASAPRAGSVPDRFAIAPASPARGFGGDVPDGVDDYVLAVRPQPDAWGTVRFAAGPADSAVNGRSRGEVGSNATARAAELGIAPAARVLATRSWTNANDWVDTLLAPLAMGGSIVLVANADPARTERRAAQERAGVVIV